MNNTDERTNDLPQKPVRARSIAPLFQELLVEVREMKRIFQTQVVDSLERIEQKADSVEAQVKLLREDQVGIRTDAINLARRVDELERRAS